MSDLRRTQPSRPVSNVVELSERIDRAGQAMFTHPKSRYCGRTVAWIAENDDCEPPYLVWYLAKGLDPGLRHEILIYLRARRPELLARDEGAA